MIKKTTIHAAVLIIAISLSFLFPKTGLADYDIQFAAILFIILFIVRRFLPGDRNRERLLESVIFTLIITTTVNLTGSVNSPFFFLIYFLLFSLTLLLEPIIAITTTLTFIVLFLLSLPESQDLKSLLPIFSLAFLTPFAMLLGQMYLKSETEHRANVSLKESLSETNKETFLFLSLMLKNHLRSIQLHIENFMGDHDLRSIKKHASEMEKLIGKFESENDSGLKT